ncbi:hypothetical protein [Candidatus Leptofilum sp.]|uniref:hypothetical protein n=1 Tax=Candidatus Leptofilum sp. TaxID=3241576 RepID=UPI003B5AD2F6
MHKHITTIANGQLEVKQPRCLPYLQFKKQLVSHLTQPGENDIYPLGLWALSLANGRLHMAH